MLRLVPDQVVRATGHQLALWGETVVSDRVARAAMRVQAMLGHEAVLRPVLGGGRDVSEQVNHVPFGEKREPRLAASRAVARADHGCGARSWFTPSPVRRT